MSNRIKILIAEDCEADAILLVREIRRAGYEPTYERVETEDGLRQALERQPWDVVVSDFSMPQFNARAVARIVAEMVPEVPLIVVSGAVGEEEAAAIMRDGARDFILKSHLKRLTPAIVREIEAARMRRDKRQADERLDRERELLRQLMEGIPDAIFFKDLQHRYVHLNDAHRRALSVGKGEDVVGHTAEKFLSAARARTHHEEEEWVLSNGKPMIGCVERWNMPDGTTRWVSATKAPIRDPHGKIIGVVGIARDITESKRQEQLKNEFIATVSHELRTPITAIIGAIGMLTTNAAGYIPETASRLIRIAYGNCQRLARIVNDILDFETIESGKMQCDRKLVELRALVEQIVEANQTFAAYHDVRLRIESAQGPIAVLADPDRLGQVISNLLANALKFSPPEAEVVVSTHLHGQHGRVSVRDQGPGIPDDYKQRIFEKFVQVDASDSRKKGGTGLGLSIAKQIIVALRGSIDVEDAEGGGAVFHITLPLSEALKEPPEAITRHN